MPCLELCAKLHLGLFCARDLVLLGYTNVTIRAAAFDDLTSHKAGGLWAPAFIILTNDEKQAIFQRVFKFSLDFYRAVIANPSDPLHRGVVNIPLYNMDRMPYLNDLYAPPKQITLDFGNSVRRKMYAYDDAIYMEPNVLMQILSKYGVSEGHIYLSGRRSPVRVFIG